MYIFGGEHVARTPIDSTFHCVDLGADGKDAVWETCRVTAGTPPIPRVAHAQAVVGNEIYIFGGRQGISMSESPLNDLHVYSTEDQRWTDLSNDTSGDPPSPRSFHRMISVGKKLFVFGGCGESGRLNDLYSFDTVTRTWTAHPSCEELPGRGGPGFVASGDGSSLFVIGGFAGKEMNDVFCFDLATEKWSELHAHGAPGNKLRPFSVSCGGLLNSNIVFFGGE